MKRVQVGWLAGALVALAALPSGVRATETVRRCDGVRATIVGNGGDNELNGTSGPDVIVGGGGRDTIHAGDGRDIICGNGGRDSLDGGDGSDRIFGGRGNDWLDGGVGDEYEGHNQGDAKRDVLNGGRHNDTCSGHGHDRPRNCELFVVE